MSAYFLSLIWNSVASSIWYTTGLPPQPTMKFFLVLKNYVSLQVSLYQIDPGHQYETKIQAITEIKIFDSVNKNIFILSAHAYPD